MSARGLALVLCLAFLAGIPPASAADAPPLVRASRIPLYPMHPEDRHAGKLIYRGGLVLASSDPGFGGWSDLAVSADGSRIVSISDEAHWLRLGLAYDSDGDLAGVSDAEIAPMLGRMGEHLPKAEGDAEGMTAVVPNRPDGEVLVSFERDDRIWRYDLSHGIAGVLPEPGEVPLGPWAKTLRNNLGMEAITLWRPDTLLALAEFTLDANGDMKGALEDFPGDPQHLHTRMLGVIRHPPYEITSLAPAPDGGVFILERRFTIVGGVGMELRHVAPEEIHQGARLQGDVIAALTYQDANIDNMEGLAARKGTRGETLLYMISDDDYSPIQRTLLLMFEVAP
jgi:hypothetical protein